MGGTANRWKFQIGQETTAGTAVAATVIMAGWGASGAAFEDERTRETWREGDGRYGVKAGDQ